MISAWVIDGGFPLLIGYGGAVVVAACTTRSRIALTSKDRDVSFWAAVVVAQNLSARGALLQLRHVPVADRAPVLAPERGAPRGRRPVPGARPAAAARRRRPAQAAGPRPWPPGRAAT